MRNHRSITMLALFLVWSSPAEAFNWAKCESEVIGKPKLSPFNKNGLFGATTGQKTTGASSSSTSYVSSTGACSAIAKTMYERRVFIVENRSDLEKQCARGDGEHLTTLAALYGCPSHESREVAESLHENCAKTLINDESVDRVDDAIKRVLVNSSAACRYANSIVD